VLETPNKTYLTGKGNYTTYDKTGDVVECLEPNKTAGAITSTSFESNVFSTFSNETQEEIKEIATKTNIAYEESNDETILAAGQVMIWEATGYNIVDVSANLSKSFNTINSTDIESDVFIDTSNYTSTGQDFIQAKASKIMKLGVGSNTTQTSLEVTYDIFDNEKIDSLDYYVNSQLQGSLDYGIGHHSFVIDNLDSDTNYEITFVVNQGKDTEISFVSIMSTLKKEPQFKKVELLDVSSFDVMIKVTLEDIDDALVIKDNMKLISYSNGIKVVEVLVDNLESNTQYDAYETKLEFNLNNQTTGTVNVVIPAFKTLLAPPVFVGSSMEVVPSYHEVYITYLLEDADNAMTSGQSIGTEYVDGVLHQKMELTITNLEPGIAYVDHPQTFLTVTYDRGNGTENYDYELLPFSTREYMNSLSGETHALSSVNDISFTIDLTMRNPEGYHVNDLFIYAIDPSGNKQRFDLPTTNAGTQTVDVSGLDPETKYDIEFWAYYDLDGHPYEKLLNETLMETPRFDDMLDGGMSVFDKTWRSLDVLVDLDNPRAGDVQITRQYIKIFDGTTEIGQFDAPANEIHPYEINVNNLEPDTTYSIEYWVEYNTPFEIGLERKLQEYDYDTDPFTQEIVGRIRGPIDLTSSELHFWIAYEGDDFGIVKEEKIYKDNIEVASWNAAGGAATEVSLPGLTPQTTYQIRYSVIIDTPTGDQEIELLNGRVTTKVFDDGLTGIHSANQVTINGFDVQGLELIENTPSEPITITMEYLTAVDEYGNEIQRYDLTPGVIEDRSFSGLDPGTDYIIKHYVEYADAIGNPYVKLLQYGDIRTLDVKGEVYPPIHIDHESFEFGTDYISNGAINPDRMVNIYETDMNTLIDTVHFNEHDIATDTQVITNLKPETNYYLEYVIDYETNNGTHQKVVDVKEVRTDGYDAIISGETTIEHPEITGIQLLLGIYNPYNYNIVTETIRVSEVNSDGTFSHVKNVIVPSRIGSADVSIWINNLKWNQLYFFEHYVTYDDPYLGTTEIKVDESYSETLEYDSNVSGYLDISYRDSSRTKIKFYYIDPLNKVPQDRNNVRFTIYSESGSQALRKEYRHASDTTHRRTITGTGSSRTWIYVYEVLVEQPDGTYAWEKIAETVSRP